MSSHFWLYWAATIPATLLIVGLWFLWQTRRQRVYDLEDQDLEVSAEETEKEIMTEMWETTNTKLKENNTVP